MLMGDQQRHSPLVCERRGGSGRVAARAAALPEVEWLADASVPGGRSARHAMRARSCRSCRCYAAEQLSLLSIVIDTGPARSIRKWIEFSSLHQTFCDPS